jgi:hypothetical protein
MDLSISLGSQGVPDTGESILEALEAVDLGNSHAG